MSRDAEGVVVEGLLDDDSFRAVLRVRAGAKSSSTNWIGANANRGASVDTASSGIRVGVTLSERIRCCRSWGLHEHR